MRMCGDSRGCSRRLLALPRTRCESHPEVALYISRLPPGNTAGLAVRTPNAPAKKPACPRSSRSSVSGCLSPHGRDHKDQHGPSGPADILHSADPVVGAFNSDRPTVVGTPSRGGLAVELKLAACALTKPSRTGGRPGRSGDPQRRADRSAPPGASSGRDGP